MFGIAFAFFKIQNALTKGGIRPEAEVELQGLDLPEMGVLGYVPEETYAVQTASQDYLATFGPGVPPKGSSSPTKGAGKASKEKERQR